MLRYVLLFVVLAAGGLGQLPAAAAVPKIDDRAGFFSKEAVEKATQKLSEIQRRYKVEVVLETFAAIPEEKKSGYKPEEKAGFFKRWAETRATDQGVKGIYMLICKDPAYLFMEPDQAVRRKAFTLDDRNALVAKVRKQMREKQYDAALTDLVNSIDTTLAANSAPRRTNQ